MPRPSWDEWAMNIARVVSTRADCTRRQVGAVIISKNRHLILATGYNGAPSGESGCATSGACPRGRKSYDDVAAFSDYRSGEGKCIAVHAEENALNNLWSACAASTMYVTCKPCSDCMMLIGRSPLSGVVWPGGFESWSR